MAHYDTKTGEMAVVDPVDDICRKELARMTKTMKENFGFKISLIAGGVDGYLETPFSDKRYISLERLLGDQQEKTSEWREKGQTWGIRDYLTGKEFIDLLLYNYLSKENTGRLCKEKDFSNIHLEDNFDLHSYTYRFDNKDDSDWDWFWYRQRKTFVKENPVIFHGSEFFGLIWDNLYCPYVQAEEVSFFRGWLPKANFQEANLKKTVFSFAYLCGADFRKTDLRRSNFRGAYLCEADFRGANLEAADFEQAILVGTKFSK